MSNYNELKLTYQGGRQETITLTTNTIDDGAYQDRGIIAVEVPEIVEIIDGYAFCDNNELANIVLNEGLQRIEGQAFQHGVYTAVTIPSTVTYIGFNSFNIREEQDQGQHTFTITCLASTPPTLDDPEGITFGNPRFLSAIYVPDGSVSAYQEAWPAYASKIQGGAAPAPTDNTLTNLNIKAAYVGDTQVVKIYLGTDAVWEKVEEPEAQLFYNGESVTGTQTNPTVIPINSTDTSIVFDVVMKDQSTPWVITHGGAGERARGTGSTQNVNVEVLPNIPEWRMEPQTLVYKKDGDQDMDWTGEASVIRYRVNNA